MIFNALPRVTINVFLKRSIKIFFLKKLMVTRWKIDKYVLILQKV